MALHSERRGTRSDTGQSLKRGLEGERRAEIDSPPTPPTLGSLSSTLSLGSPPSYLPPPPPNSHPSSRRTSGGTCTRLTRSRCVTLSYPNPPAPLPPKLSFSPFFFFALLSVVMDTFGWGGVRRGGRGWRMEPRRHPTMEAATASSISCVSRRGVCATAVVSPAPSGVWVGSPGATITGAHVIFPCVKKLRKWIFFNLIRTTVLYKYEYEYFTGYNSIPFHTVEL